VFFHALSAPALNINPFLGRETQRLHEFGRGLSHDGNVDHVTVAGSSSA
jgi:hypothetical protein